MWHSFEHKNSDILGNNFGLMLIWMFELNLKAARVACLSRAIDKQLFTGSLSEIITDKSFVPRFPLSTAVLALVLNVRKESCKITYKEWQSYNSSSKKQVQPKRSAHLKALQNLLYKREHFFLEKFL